MNKRKKIYLYLVLFVMLIFVRIPVMEYYYHQRSENLLQTLTPEAREKANDFLQKAKVEGISLMVADAYRSPEKQNELYAQGRTQSGKIVTYAKGGASAHNYRTAIDVYPIVFGFANVLNKDWKQIARIGKTSGFKWGGDWKTFKDYPHFEL